MWRTSPSRSTCPCPLVAVCCMTTSRRITGRAKVCSCAAMVRIVNATQVQAYDLSDVGDGTWAHQPSDRIAIDPVLGRIAFPQNEPPPATVHVTFHAGFSADMGGGEYERAASFDALLQPVQQVSAPATLQSALDARRPGGVVEISDSGRYGSH